MTDTPAAPLAPPPPTAADAPMAPEAAKAAIAGMSVELKKAYAAGDVAATQHVTELHKLAYPDQGGDGSHRIDLSAGRAPAVAPAVAPEPDAASEAPAPIAAEEYDVPLKFGPDATVPHMQEARALAQQTAAALGLSVPLARGGIEMLDQAIATRGGKPMDQLELAQFDALVESRWGDQHAAKSAAVRAALARAGKGGEWLRQAMLSSGPITALWVLESLAANQARAPK